MGLLDDAASVISARTSHSKRSKSHRSSHHKDRSKSRSRSRSRHRSSRSAAGVGGGITGIAASIFGGGDDDHHHKHDRDRDHHHRSSSKRRGSHRDKDEDGTRSFFGLPNPGKGSSFFSGFGASTTTPLPPPSLPLSLAVTNPPPPPPGGRHSPAGSSYYKRSPRPGFVSRVLKKLKRLLRDLLYYAKRRTSPISPYSTVPPRSKLTPTNIDQTPSKSSCSSSCRS